METVGLLWQLVRSVCVTRVEDFGGAIRRRDGEIAATFPHSAARFGSVIGKRDWEARLGNRGYIYSVPHSAARFASVIRKRDWEARFGSAIRKSRLHLFVPHSAVRFGSVIGKRDSEARLGNRGYIHLCWLLSDFAYLANDGIMALCDFP